MSPQRPLSAIVESTARFLEETAPDSGDGVPVSQVGADDLVRPTLALAPRPLSQFARRLAREYDLEYPYGLRSAVYGWPYYHQKRRTPAVWCDPWVMKQARRRRSERAQERRAPAVRTRLPPMFYDRAQVA